MLKDIPPESRAIYHRVLPLARPGFEQRIDPLRPPVECEIGLDRQAQIGNKIWAFDAHDPRARSFVLLRSQLMSRFCGSGGRILAVSSTLPREGKTLLVANLAVALSRIHPTVAIDLDLRRPALAERFGIPVQSGVDDVLAGRAEWVASGYRAANGLTIHGVREPVDNPTELLASEALHRIFRTLRQLPDAPVCIVDTPPVLVLDDTNIIARHVDGILMVIEEGKTRARDLKKAVESLAPAKIVGSVLNRSISILRSDIDDAYYANRPQA